LAKRNLINYEPYDLITLTALGQEAAEQVAGRHDALFGFLVRVLGVDQREADAAACRMEHAIPEAILARFVDFVTFVERCPRGGVTWVDGAGFFCGSCGSSPCGRAELKAGNAPGPAEASR
jgi:DtxR family Mn-dependent transcriptional regulator